MLKELIGATLLTMGVGATTPTPFYLNADQNTTTNITISHKVNYNTYDSVNPLLNMNVVSKLNIQNNETRLLQYSKINTSHWNIENIPLKNITAINNDVLVNEGFNYNLDNSDVFYFKYKPNEVINNTTINVSIKPNLIAAKLTNISNAQLLVRYSILIGNNSLESLYNKWQNQTLGTEYQNKDRIYDLNNYYNRYATNQVVYKNEIFTPYTIDAYTYGFNAKTIEIPINNLAYQQESYIFISAYYYWYSNYANEEIWNTLPRIDSDDIATNDATIVSYQDISLNYYIPSGITINYDVVDVPDLIFTILTTPFAFMSQAFNFTLFPGTQYALNISNLLLAIVGILVFIFIIKFFVKRV